MTVTREQEEQAKKVILELRTILQGEAELLANNYDPRLIAYVCLTTSIKMAERAGLSPDQYAKLAADTIALFCRAEPADMKALKLTFAKITDPDLT